MGLGDCLVNINETVLDEVVTIYNTYYFHDNNVNPYKELVTFFVLFISYILGNLHGLVVINSGVLGLYLDFILSSLVA